MLIFTLWLATTVIGSALTIVALDYRRADGRGALA